MQDNLFCRNYTDYLHTGLLGNTSLALPLSFSASASGLMFYAGVPIASAVVHTHEAGTSMLPAFCCPSRSSASCRVRPVHDLH